MQNNQRLSKWDEPPASSMFQLAQALKAPAESLPLRSDAKVVLATAVPAMRNGQLEVS